MLTLPNLLDAVAIEFASSNTWNRVISVGYDTLEKIRSMTEDHIANVTVDNRSIGEKRAAKIHASLHSPRVSELLDRANVWLAAPKEIKISTTIVPLKYPLEGMVVVMTGTGPDKRKNLEDKLLAAGAVLGSDVNRGTNYLICEDTSGTSSKLKKATSLGVTLLNYSEVF